jgi:hypothetical protein
VRKEFLATQPSVTVSNMLASLSLQVGMLIGAVVMFIGKRSDMEIHYIGSLLLPYCLVLSTSIGISNYYITEASFILLNMVGDTRKYRLTGILRIEGPLNKKNIHGVARYLLSARKGNVIRITFTNGETLYCSPREQREFLNVLQERTGIPITGSPSSLKGTRGNVINQV